MCRTLRFSILPFLLAAGCATPTSVISTDLTRVSGVYVVGYVDRDDVRAKLENRFVEDLAAQNIRAVPSAPDIRQIKKARPADLVRAANTHDVAAIVVINRVSGDGSDSIIDSERRIAPDDPDLTVYFERTREELDQYGSDDPVFAEVNAFLVDGNKTRRFWTGTSWAFQGEEDQVIGSISETIAAELAKVAGEMRSYGRPMD
jgi:hypothetical protein